MIHFFALNKDKTDNYKKYVPHIKAMINSIKSNAPSLESYFIYDGSPDKLTRWLDNRGVKTIYHKSILLTHPLMSGFYESAFKNKAQFPNFNKEVAEGTFLRLDIPLIMDMNKQLDLYKHGNHVLYTDCDIIFNQDPKQALQFIGKSNDDKAFCVAKEFNYSEENKYYNTGVMLMNLPVYKKWLFPESPKEMGFFNYIGNYASFHKFQDYDQMPLNVFFKDKLGVLPDSFNHRPYNGIDKDAFIVHYHGLKYHQLKDCLKDGKHPVKVLNELYHKDTESFKYYFELFEKYLFAK